LQNLAFVVLLSGVLLLYAELVWIGKIYLGAAGAMLLLVGMAALWKLPHNTTGLTLIAASVIAFLLEAFFPINYLAGVAATILLAGGFWKLCPAPDAISPALVFSFTTFLGALTVKLLAIGKQARQNKKSDL
jgi:membrane-bound serine protease (ClpP class)